MDKATQLVDYLIIGQGLAGTLLSYRFTKAGIAHMVLDKGHMHASSNAAAGIVNPVTGRRFVKAWHISTLLNGLSLYTELEELLGVHLLNRITVYRDLSETSALNQWDMRRNDEAYSPYLGKPNHDLNLCVRTPSVVGPTLQAAQVNLRELIRAYRARLLETGSLVEDEHSIDEAKLVGDRWHIGRFAARRIIDCTGAEAIKTDTWGKLPWRGTKGEALRFPLRDFPRNLTIKKKHFVCPIGTSNEVWLGGTNQDHFIDDKPSEDGRKRLEEQATAFSVDLPIDAERLSAIRPTVNDRRPLVGEHPKKPGIWICNGLGTRGTSLGPYCTQQLLDVLLSKSELDPEIEITDRFID